MMMVVVVTLEQKVRDHRRHISVTIVARAIVVAIMPYNYISVMMMVVMMVQIILGLDKTRLGHGVLPIGDLQALDGVGNGIEQLRE